MIEVLKQALDALETEVSIDWTNNDEFNASAEKMHDAITSLQQAIAQLESKEPVAWMHIMDNTEGIKANGAGIVSITQKRKHPFGKAGIDFSKSYPVTSTPLYTHPPQRTWMGLTDEEIRERWFAAEPTPDGRSASYNYARAIEAKLKQKNGFAEEKNT